MVENDTLPNSQMWTSAAPYAMSRYARYKRFRKRPDTYYSRLSSHPQDLPPPPRNYSAVTIASEDVGAGILKFAAGAVRGTDAEGERWDLITPIGLRRLAETCAEGARNYSQQTTASKLQTANYSRQTTASKVQAANYGQQNTASKPRRANYRQQTTGSKLQAAN